MGGVGHHDNGNDGEVWVVLDEPQKVEAVARGHVKIGEDVGRELKLLAVGEAAFSFEVGDGFIAVYGELDFEVCA